MLTEESIKKFQKIYKEKLGKDISIKEASEQALKLLNFVKAVAGYLENKNSAQVNNQN